MNHKTQIEVNQQVNRVYAPLFTNNNVRYVILMGGRGAGRSTAASQYATANLLAPDYFRCAIMRFVLSDVRNSIFQDISDRIDEQDLRDTVRVREHELLFRYGANKINGLGFRKSSGDQKAKMKSLANYNSIIIEEADEVAEEDFMQLDDSIRTTRSNIKIVLLLNPPEKNHWIIKRWFNLLPTEAEGFYLPELKEIHKHNTLFIRTDYRVNKANISQSSILNWEGYRETKPDHYWNMIRGYVSEGRRGRIYKNWKPISEAEYDALEFIPYYGLDFGFTNDPTALIEIKEHNNRVYTKELIYETGLTNPMISKRMGQLGIDKSAAIIWADSAEPKSVEEIGQDGWTIKPAEKGQGSVNAGIDMMLSREVFYVETSDNIREEHEDYRWALNRYKEPTNTPVDEDNHAMDAIRYGVYSNNKQPFIGFV